MEKGKRFPPNNQNKVALEKRIFISDYKAFIYGPKLLPNG